MPAAARKRRAAASDSAAVAAAGAPASTKDAKKKGASALAPPSKSRPLAKIELAVVVRDDRGDETTFKFVPKGRKFLVCREAPKSKPGEEAVEHLLLPNSSVSSRHAEIEWHDNADAPSRENDDRDCYDRLSADIHLRARAPTNAFGGAFVCVDLGSSNGTANNGLKVEPGEPFELQHGDELAFGNGGARATVSLSLPDDAVTMTPDEMEAWAAADEAGLPPPDLGRPLASVEHYMACAWQRSYDGVKVETEQGASRVRGILKQFKEAMLGDAMEARERALREGKTREEAMAEAERLIDECLPSGERGDVAAAAAAAAGGRGKGGKRGGR